MTGKLKKVGDNWVVTYWYQRTNSHGMSHPNEGSLPLDPFDALALNQQLQIFDNLEARVAANPEVEFEIVEEDEEFLATPESVEWGIRTCKYARLTEPLKT